MNPPISDRKNDDSPVVAMRAAAIVFAILSLAHIWRVVARVPMSVGNFQIPMWASIVATVITAVLSLWLWKGSVRHV